MINIHILGAGGAVPTPSHTPAAYQVVLDGSPLLVDPGPGALVRLVQAGLAPGGVDDIGNVLLTHLHPDHCSDLVPLLFATHSPVTYSTDPLRLFGPPGLKAYLDSLNGIYGSWLTPSGRQLEVTEVTPGNVLNLPGGGLVNSFRVNHPQSHLSEMCLGYTFIDHAGCSVVYSGDTGPCPELKKAATNCDLLVVECSTTNAFALNGHMNPQMVGELCAAALPRRVVLTHQYPEAAAADLVTAVNEYFKGTVIQAVDGDSFYVGAPGGATEDFK